MYRYYIKGVTRILSFEKGPESQLFSIKTQFKIILEGFKAVLRGLSFPEPPRYADVKYLPTYIIIIVIYI